MEGNHEELQQFVGKRIKKIMREEFYNTKVTIIFEDNSALVIDAEGDDMAHVIVDIYENLSE